MWQARREQVGPPRDATATVKSDTTKYSEKKYKAHHISRSAQVNEQSQHASIFSRFFHPCGEEKQKVCVKKAQAPFFASGRRDIRSGGRMRPWRIGETRNFGSLLT
jgi:hypothetical protein